MQDKKLRKKLHIWDEKELENNIFIGKLDFLVDSLVVDNYFQDCPCCENQKYLITIKAKSFKKWNNYYDCVDTYYTTEKSYQIHKSQIEEWAKEVNKLK